MNYRIVRLIHVVGFSALDSVCRFDYIVVTDSSISPNASNEYFQIGLLQFDESNAIIDNGANVIKIHRKLNKTDKNITGINYAQKSIQKLIFSAFK